MEIVKAAHEHMSPTEAEYFVSHSPCLDGDTAAMLAIKSRLDLKFYGYDHTKPFDLAPLIGKNVIFADCAPTPEQYDAIVAQGGKVLVLDHHAPAMAKLKDKLIRD